MGESGVVVLDDELDLAAEDATLGVDFGERELRAANLAFAFGGIRAGQRVVHADLDRRFALSVRQDRMSDERRRTERKPGFQRLATSETFHGPSYGLRFVTLNGPVQPPAAAL